MVIIDKVDKEGSVEERSVYGIDDQDGSGSSSSKESPVGPPIPMMQDSAVRHSNLFGSGNNLTPKERVQRIAHEQDVIGQEFDRRAGNVVSFECPAPPKQQRGKKQKRRRVTLSPTKKTAAATS